MGASDHGKRVMQTLLSLSRESKDCFSSPLLRWNVKEGRKVLEPPKNPSIMYKQRFQEHWLALESLIPYPKYSYMLYCDTCNTQWGQVIAAYFSLLCKGPDTEGNVFVHMTPFHEI